MVRQDGRRPDQIRPVRISIGVQAYPEGSALIEMGATHVLCAASIEAGVPGWLRGQGRGWLTGEYAMLPSATSTRSRRERNGASGRTQEIQRLLGRSLRAAIDLEALGERTITIDCDVLQADGGTRTAAITGGYVALALAIRKLSADGILEQNPLRRAVAAISVGVVDGVPLLDLDYSEDSRADIDGNIVQTEHGDYIELQTTAEGSVLARDQIPTLLNLAWEGIQTLLEAQHNALHL